MFIFDELLDGCSWDSLDFNICYLLLHLWDLLFKQFFIESFLYFENFVPISSNARYFLSTSTKNFYWSLRTTVKFHTCKRMSRFIVWQIMECLDSYFSQLIWYIPISLFFMLNRIDCKVQLLYTAFIRFLQAFVAFHDVSSMIVRFNRLLLSSMTLLGFTFWFIIKFFEMDFCTDFFRLI